MTDVTRMEDGVLVTRTAEADAAIYGAPPAPQPPTVPDNPTLSDWRSAGQRPLPPQQEPSS